MRWPLNAGYSQQELNRALLAPTGARKVDFCFDLLRDGAKVCSLDATGQIFFNRFADIKRTARFTIEEDSRINWLTDLVKPSMRLWMGDGWAQFPLGVFVLSTPTRIWRNGRVYYEVQAYDQSVILQEDCLTSRLFIAAQTPYIQAVSSVLYSAGLNQVMADSNQSVLPRDCEFEIGTSKLQVVNTLLSQINFQSISVDEDGIFCLRKYTSPSAAQTTYQYTSGQLSVLGTEVLCEQDLYNTPNVFIAVVSNPENDEALQSVYVNDNPTSPLSTVQRGRRIVSPIYKPDMVESQEALDAIVQRIAHENSQVYEIVTFQTPLMPMHSEAEVLYIDHPNAQGVYVESAWEMPLHAGAAMVHRARRLTQLW